MNRTLSAGMISILLLVSAVCHSQTHPREVEPSVETAKTWWDEETNVWTPIGWKSNYNRYVVLYNGALIIDPSHGLMGPRPNSREFVGNDFLVQLHTTLYGDVPPLPPHRMNVREIDYGHGIQGWNNSHETPVLWTEHRIQSGVFVRQEVFAHQEGCADVKHGLEPLYAWMRIRVDYVDPMRHPESQAVNLRLCGSYYEHDAECYDPRSSEPSFKITVNPALAAYHNPLEATVLEESDMILITEPDGKVRAGVMSADKDRVTFFKQYEGVYGLRINLKACEGDHIDVLVPLMPQEKDAFLKEAGLTYNGALEESDRYWAQRPQTAARINIPEKYIEEAIERNLKFAPVVSELDHKTGQHSYLTGAWGYDCLWPTPTSTVSHMLADQYGYHDLTMLNSEIFRLNQGSIKAPGALYPVHPGYYGAPRTLTSYDWLSDHGAILHQVATSCLLSGNREHADHWTESIVAACDFIKDMCAVTGHGGIEGLLPPGVASDDGISTQAVWNIAWNYKGLTSAVKLLKWVGHPRYEEFNHLAENTKEIFSREYHRIAEEGPKWTDSEGKVRYMPPTTMSSGPMPFHVFSEAFYLDTGPMVLVWAGLMDADDPVMSDLVDYFRHGPNGKYFTPVYNCIWRPSLQHEISTCEPCYSFNIFHSWQKGERVKYLEGMYSLFTGGMSQNTYISCEHRHGIQGNLFVAPLAAYLAKLAVIDEAIEPGALHLLRLCPLAWVSDKEFTIFANMPTEYGPVDLEFGLVDEGRTLEVRFDGKWRQKPESVILHLPPVDGLRKVRINGRCHRYDGKPIEIR